jgi:hypothetical protein
MASFARFRPERETSSVARKPEGVRDAAFAASAAMDRSRRALALSLFSSWGRQWLVGLRGDGGNYYSARHFWRWRRPRWRLGRRISRRS